MTQKKKKSSSQRLRASHGTIFLVDDTPAKRSARAEHLRRSGFDVEIATSITEAKTLWKPERYRVVLVAMKNDVKRAAEFCDDMKDKYPQQTVGMLVSAGAVLPPTRCPDLLWPEENLAYLLARVKTLADFSRAA